MKRDMDLVRDILLAVEAGRKLQSDQVFDQINCDDKELFVEHIRMLTEDVFYIRAIKAHTLGSRDWLDMELTWHGHEFIDAIRDPEIWRKTKEGMAQAGGFSFDLVKALAKGYLKKKIEQLTDIQLDL